MLFSLCLPIGGANMQKPIEYNVIIQKGLRETYKKYCAIEDQQRPAKMTEFIVADSRNPSDFPHIFEEGFEVPFIVTKNGMHRATIYIGNGDFSDPDEDQTEIMVAEDTHYSQVDLAGEYNLIPATILGGGSLHFRRQPAKKKGELEIICSILGHSPYGPVPLEAMDNIEPKMKTAIIQEGLPLRVILPELPHYHERFGSRSNYMSTQWQKFL
jgi:hypothetical protein